MTNNAPLPVLVNTTTNERHTIDQTTVILGRAPENFIVVSDDIYASAEHVRVYCAEGIWYAEDLMSSNGTTINGELITEPFQLAPGDVIKVGRTLFRIE